VTFPAASRPWFPFLLPPKWDSSISISPQNDPLSESVIMIYAEISGRDDRRCYMRDPAVLLVLWISSTAPRNPIIIVAGRNADGNSGTGVPYFLMGNAVSQSVLKPRSHVQFREFHILQTLQRPHILPVPYRQISILRISRYQYR
jgi:hypothetical protein